MYHEFSLQEFYSLVGKMRENFPSPSQVKKHYRYVKIDLVAVTREGRH